MATSVKQKIVFYGLVLLTLISIADGLLMKDFMSLVVAIFLGFLADLAKAGSKPGAPYAGEKKISFGDARHQLVYVQALRYSMFRIEHDRENGGHLAPVNSDWRKRYDHDKWTYALLFNRYQTAKQKYGWK